MIGSLIGGIMGKAGGDAAAAAATDAANRQEAATKVARADLSPWRVAGAGAIDEVSRLLGLGGFASDTEGNYTLEQSGRDYYQQLARNRFQTDPGYQFRIAEGEKGINRSAAARTGTLNPAAVKALDRFNQDTASQEFSNYVNRMMGVAGLGGSAAGTSASVGVAGAKAAGDDLVAAGKARQSGYEALGSGIARGFSNLNGFGYSRGWW